MRVGFLTNTNENSFLQYNFLLVCEQFGFAKTIDRNLIHTINTQHIMHVGAIELFSPTQTKTKF
jgi:hypothetical protein